MSIEELIEASIRSAAFKSAYEVQDIINRTIKEFAATLKDAKYNANDLLTEEQVSEYLGIAVNTLRQWRSDKKCIQYHKVGSSVRYKFVDILEFVNSNKILVTKG